MNASTLKPSDPCFIRLYDAMFAGVVRDVEDSQLYVISEAAQRMSRSWQGLLFHRDTGKAIYGDAEIVTPLTIAEHRDFVEAVEMAKAKPLGTGALRATLQDYAELPVGPPIVKRQTSEKRQWWQERDYQPGDEE